MFGVANQRRTPWGHANLSSHGISEVLRPLVLVSLLKENCGDARFGAIFPGSSSIKNPTVETQFHLDSSKKSNHASQFDSNDFPVAVRIPLRKAEFNLRRSAVPTHPCASPDVR